MCTLARSYVVLACVVIVAIFLACSSDDDSGTNSPGKTPGSETDLSYILFKSNLFAYSKCQTDRIQDILELCQMIEGRKSSNSAPLALEGPVYHAESRYWYFEHTDTSYYGVEVGHDSVQFLHSGTVVETPDSALLTEVRGGTHWVLIEADAAGGSEILASSDTLFSVNCSANISGEPGEIIAAGNLVISVNSSFEGLPPGMSSDCDRDDQFTAAGEDISINLAYDNCPSSGTIDYSGSLIVDCPAPAPSFSNDWSARESYSSGSVSWHIENETKYWDTPGYCIWYLSF